MTTLVLLFLALLVGGIVFVLANRETLTPEAFRAGSGYQEARLGEGTTAYLDLGPRDGPVIVIVHGATLGSLAYQPYHEGFLEAGYRVITFDGWGRGFSDRIAGPLGIESMRRQLLELLDALEISQAALYGISLGGAVVARFGAAHPERTMGIGFQVPLVHGAESGGLLRLARVPLLNRFLARTLMVPQLIRRGEAVGTDSPAAAALYQHFCRQFEVIGTEQNILSMLIGDATGNRLPDHAAIAAAGIPVQFVYATDDPEIPRATVEAAIDCYATPDVHRYEGGHFFSGNRQTELAEKLTSFLASATR